MKKIIGLALVLVLGISSSVSAKQLVVRLGEKEVLVSKNVNYSEVIRNKESKKAFEQFMLEETGKPIDYTKISPLEQYQMYHKVK